VENEALGNGFILLILGMGMVFIFLTLLMGVMYMNRWIAEKFETAAPTVTPSRASSANKNVEVAIATAIAFHLKQKG